MSESSLRSPFLVRNMIEPFPFISILESSPNLTFPVTLLSILVKNSRFPVIWLLAPLSRYHRLSMLDEVLSLLGITLRSLRNTTSFIINSSASCVVSASLSLVSCSLRSRSGQCIAKCPILSQRKHTTLDASLS